MLRSYTKPALAKEPAALRKVGVCLCLCLRLSLYLYLYRLRSVQLYRERNRKIFLD